MKIRYNKLWKILIDKNMNKVQLREAAGISSNSLAKLGKKRTRAHGRPDENRNRLGMQSRGTI